jgi:hypothetical protein
MKTFSYNCKFCGKPGTCQADESGLWMFHPEIWLPKMACNRCGKFMEESRTHGDAIAKVCRTLQTCRTGLDERRKQEIEATAKLKLVMLTKRLAMLVCDYHRVTNVWDQEFCEILFEKPEFCRMSIRVYLRGIRHVAKEAFAEPTTQHNDP